MKKLSQFNEVDNDTLRAWNRFAVYFNAVISVGPAKANAYMSGFSNADKVHLQKMLADMKMMGYEAMKAAISRGEYAVS
jgi:hypothetical protein